MKKGDGWRKIERIIMQRSCRLILKLREREVQKSEGGGVSIAAKVERMHNLRIIFETENQSIAQIMLVFNSLPNKDRRHYIRDAGLCSQ
jgi:hypothetical protein